MEDKRRSDTFKSPSNLLLSGGRGGFSLEDITASPLLVPVTENSSSVLTSDVGPGPSGPSAGAAVAGESAPAPAPDPQPAPLPPPPALVQTGSGSGGFVSSLGNFTSALFGSLPAAADPPSHPEGPEGPEGRPALLPVGPAPTAPPLQPSELLDDSFQPVSLEPVTGPTPTFYNPASLGVGLGVGHAEPPPAAQPGAPSALSAPQPPEPEPGAAGVFAVTFEPQPSDFRFTQTYPAGPVGPTTPLTSGLSFESTSSSPPFSTPTGPLPVNPFGAFGSPSASASPLGSAPAPSGPSPGPSLGNSFGPPPAPPGPPPGPPGPPPGGAPSSNAFRLGGRRPVYAPVPGLGASASAAPALPIPILPAAGPTGPAGPGPGPAVMAPTAPPTPTVDSPTSPDPFNTGNYFESQISMSPDQSPPALYRSVYQHWFFKKEVENKIIWQPFSMSDSLALESQFLSPDLSAETEVSTDGGRYDVNILRRQRVAVYWDEAATEVRRCSWFYKGNTDSRYVPYDENVATRLEEEYKLSYTQNDWQRRVEFPNGESVVFHSANVMVHYLSSSSPDAWGNAPGTQHRPRVVKRGVDEFDIESGESETADHLLFIVHGVGSACDLKFRSLVEVVDDFRTISQQLVESHFSASVECGKAKRIEVLPVSWHEKLHSEDIERQLRSITLPSIPMLRHLTNDTLIDILFYTSPIYCQTIIETVAKEMNRLYALFLKRNPDFTGRVSLGGHSLGSLILFDLLWHQKGGPTPTSPMNSPSTTPIDEDSVLETTSTPKKSISPVSPMKRKLSHKVSFVMMGPAGTGQPFISYPQLAFRPENFFALGSPIGVFVTVRGIDKLGEDFELPTCPSFFNIFHPCDLVAYRVETLVRPDMEKVPPVLIPHHKGRKRMHLELKETVARMGADLKQKVLDSVKNTWNSVYQLAMFHRSTDTLTEEMNQVLEDEMNQQTMKDNSNSTEADLNIIVGKLNGGRRIDYVLQEAPLESFNEYLSAIASHVCYWKSEDTMLLMLKEMYQSIGVTVDNQIPQQHINPQIGLSSAASTSEALSNYSQVPSLSEPALLEPSPLFPIQSSPQQVMGMDPTAPPSDNRIVGPPPVSGFYRK